MAAYFQLTPRFDDAAHGPMHLHDIDAAICKHLDCNVSDQWCAGWYGAIGFYLALGWTWERIDRQLCQWLHADTIKAEPTQTMRTHAALVLISHYLQENFIVDCWEGR